jgi:hypothetical protein
MIKPTKQSLRTLGQCMYCGGPGRTEEHIIPIGLSGVQTLDKASCRTCATKSSQFELRLLRGPLLPARVVLALYTRDPKTRPAMFPARLTLNDGTEVTEDVPVSAHPAFLALPVFMPPSRLFEDRPAEGLRMFPKPWARQFSDPTQIDRWARERGAKELTWVSTVPAGPLAQLIGKIAYGFAVADLGLDRLDRQMPNPLDATVEELGPFVGGNAIVEPPEEDLHVVHVNVLDGGRVAVRVRLFARFGAPTYVAVIGRVRGEGGNWRHGTVITGGYTFRGYELPENSSHTFKIVPDTGYRAATPDAGDGDQR